MDATSLHTTTACMTLPAPPPLHVSRPSSASTATHTVRATNVQSSSSHATSGTVAGIVHHADDDKDDDDVRCNVVSDDSFQRSNDGKAEPEWSEQAAETYVVGEYNVSSCPICLEHFTLSNPAVIVHCGHGFHLQCLESWRQRSRQCPVCLQQLTENDGHVMNARDARRRRRVRGVLLHETHRRSPTSSHNKHAAHKDTVFVSSSRDARGGEECASYLITGDDATREYFVPHEPRQRVALVRVWQWLQHWCTAY